MVAGRVGEREGEDEEVFGDEVLNRLVPIYHQLEGGVLYPTHGEGAPGPEGVRPGHVEAHQPVGSL